MDLQNYLKKNHKKFLIVDFDKTILKLEINWFDYLKEIKSKLPKDSEEFFTSACQEKVSPVNYLQNLYVEKYGQKMLSFFIEFSSEFEDKHIKKFTPNSNLINFIKSHFEYIYYLWSANTHKTIEKYLQEVGIVERFLKVVCRDNVKYIKPNPEGFYLIYDKKESKKDYLFIGDSLSDQKAAAAAKIDFYKISYFN